MIGLQRLYIDGKYIGYVKRFLRDDDRNSYFFVLATIDTEDDKYQMQVGINFDNIKDIHFSDSISIITTDDAPEICSDSSESISSCEYRTGEGYCLKIRGTALPFLPYCKHKIIR